MSTRRYDARSGVLLLPGGRAAASMTMITGGPAIRREAESSVRTSGNGASDCRAAMTVGSALFLIAVSAILRYAVTASVSGISRGTVGLILMIVGGAGLVISLFYLATRSPRRR